MKRRRLMILAGSVLVVAALATWVVTVAMAPPEPVYEGKKLSVWAGELDSTNEVRRQEATVVIRRMASNSLPIIISQFRAETVREYWEEKVRAFLKWLHVGRNTKRQRNEKYADCVSIIGEPAVPDLERLLEGSSNEGVIAKGYFMILDIEQGDTNRIKLSPKAWAKVRSVWPVDPVVVDL